MLRCTEIPLPAGKAFRGLVLTSDVEVGLQPASASYLTVPPELLQIHEGALSSEHLGEIADCDRAPEVRKVLIAKGSVTSGASVMMAEEIPRQSMRAPSANHGVETRGAETILPLPTTAIAPVTSVRSTLLASSLQAVRERELVEVYTRALPKRYHDQVLHTLAPVWLPMDAALAHYRAMESLRLPEEEVLTIGRSVGNRLHGTFLGTLVRGVRQAGVTPWSVAGKIDRVWSRVFDGGALGVVKLGPKDGLVSIRGLALLSIPYFRIGWRGVLCAGIEAVARRGYVRETGRGLDSDAVDFVVSWV